MYRLALICALLSCSLTAIKGKKTFYWTLKSQKVRSSSHLTYYCTIISKLVSWITWNLIIETFLFTECLNFLCINQNKKMKYEFYFLLQKNRDYKCFTLRFIFDIECWPPRATWINFHKFSSSFFWSLKKDFSAKTLVEIQVFWFFANCVITIIKMFQIRLKILKNATNNF